MAGAVGGGGDVLLRGDGGAGNGRSGRIEDNALNAKAFRAMLRASGGDAEGRGEKEGCQSQCPGSCGDFHDALFLTVFMLIVYGWNSQCRLSGIAYDNRHARACDDRYGPRARIVAECARGHCGEGQRGEDWRGGLVKIMFRLDTLSCALTVLSTVLVGKKLWTGLVVAGVNSVIICVIGLRTAQFGFIPANLFCIAVYAVSIRAWMRENARRAIAS
jgi:hypothetical protein